MKQIKQTTMEERFSKLKINDWEFLQLNVTGFDPLIELKSFIKTEIKNELEKVKKEINSKGYNLDVKSAEIYDYTIKWITNLITQRIKEL